MTNLITKELERTFKKYPFGSQRSERLNATVIAKYYNPCGCERWLITEAKRIGHGDWVLYGYFRISDKWSWKYTHLSKLEEFEVPFGMTIERSFNLFEKTVNEYIKMEDYYL
jgi:hypothetical protein